MVDVQEALGRLRSSKWWDSTLLVGLALAIMVYTRFFGLADNYIKAFDPYLFWRIAEHIWETGGWPGPDPLRYWPFGWDSHQLTPAVPYIFVYLGRLAGSLKAALKMYPAILGLLSVLAMALLGRKLGMSGLSSVVLAVLPAYMYRTSQGFADKEAMAFFLGVLGWYFAAAAVKEKRHVPAVYAGLCLGMISAVWGGKILFVFALAPLMALFALREETKKVSVLSTSFVIYTLMQGLVPRYANFFRDPVSLAVLGLAAFGYLLRFVYTRPRLERYGKKRLLIPLGVGLVLLMAASAAFMGGPFTVIDRMVSLYQSPGRATATIRHTHTVAENQRPQWTWDLQRNQFFAQFGAFFFLAIGVLAWPVLKKAWRLATEGRPTSTDYVYAGALVLATLKIIVDFPPQTPVLLFLLGLPQLMESEDFAGLVVNSLVTFSMYTAFSVVRLFVFASLGVALGSAYFITKLVRSRDSVAVLAGYLVLFYAFYQMLPYTLSYRRGLGSSSLTTTWFENAKWMQANVPAGEPVVTWWDYGYWLQTMGNTTSLGDGGNVGPGYTLNWYTGHFFATSDYENATAWLDDWNLTYVTIDAQMLPKYWAYSTLGGISNVLNQIRFYRQHPTEYGLIPLYTGQSDDYGPVAVGELNTGGQPVYILGRIAGGGIQWQGYIGEYAYFSQQGTMACPPVGYCESPGFGDLPRLNQSAVVYPQRMIVLGDPASMHSTFARLWFFDGFGTDFRLLLNNGETKTFRYEPTANATGGA